MSKNVFILPTDKPSRLHLWTDENGSRLALCELEYSHTRNTQNIYITSDEEIKEGGYVFWEDKIYTYGEFMKMKTPVYTDYFSIILTTDQDLIADGVQTIDDEFIQWFVKNPSCEEVEVKRELIEKHPKSCAYYYHYKIIIPREQNKQMYSELVDLLERLTPIYREDTDLHQKYEEKRVEIIKKFKNK
jgi:hypothetical protein